MSEEYKLDPAKLPPAIIDSRGNRLGSPKQICEMLNNQHLRMKNLAEDLSRTKAELEEARKLLDCCAQSLVSISNLASSIPSVDFCMDNKLLAKLEEYLSNQPNESSED